MNITTPKICYGCRKNFNRTYLVFDLKDLKTYCDDCRPVNTPLVPVSSEELEQGIQQHFNDDIGKTLFRFIGKSQAVRLTPPQIYYLLQFSKQQKITNMNNAIKEAIELLMSYYPLPSIPLGSSPFEPVVNSGFKNALRYQKEEIEIWKSALASGTQPPEEPEPEIVEPEEPEIVEPEPVIEEESEIIEEVEPEEEPEQEEEDDEIFEI